LWAVSTQGRRGGNRGTEGEAYGGPWEVSIEDHNIVVVPDGDFVAEATTRYDAALIAAAPELLEALKKAREILFAYETSFQGLKLEQKQADYVDDIDKAITKATGGK
jgi:hypothetical protein